MSFREIITGGVQKALDSFMGNNSGNAPVFLMLGGFKFSLNTAVFQEIQQSKSYRWPAQERMGQRDALQFTGPGDEIMRLPGFVYPEFRGKGSEMAQIAKIAAEGKPVKLLTGMGGVLGMWVIEKVEVTHSQFKPDAAARKQEFVITIRKYSDGANV